MKSAALTVAGSKASLKFRVSVMDGMEMVDPVAGKVEVTLRPSASYRKVALQAKSGSASLSRVTAPSAIAIV